MSCLKTCWNRNPTSILMYIVSGVKTTPVNPLSPLRPAWNEVRGDRPRPLAEAMTRTGGFGGAFPPWSA